MKIDLQRFNRFKCRGPAAEQAILDAERYFGTEFPPEYSEFLRVTDGGEGFLGENAYVSLWAVDDLVRLNSSYKVKEFAPGLIIIGSDGANEAYGIDTRTKTARPFIQIPLISMDWRDAKQLSESFGGFLERLSGR